VRDGKIKSRLFAQAACREAIGYADIVSYFIRDVKLNLFRAHKLSARLCDSAACAVLGVDSPRQSFGVSLAGRRPSRCQGGWQEPSSPDPIQDETGRVPALPVPVSPRRCRGEEVSLCILSDWLPVSQFASPCAVSGVSR
jgi:hypothetical protein